MEKCSRQILPARRPLAIAPLALKKLRFYNRMLLWMVLMMHLMVLLGETAAQWIGTNREKLS